jgi:hypothetical protein
MAATTTEELFGGVFSVVSLSRCYNMDKMRLSLGTAERGEVNVL